MNVTQFVLHTILAASASFSSSTHVREPERGSSPPRSAAARAAETPLSSSTSAMTDTLVRLDDPPPAPLGYWYVGIVFWEGQYYHKYENAQGNVRLIPVG